MTLNAYALLLILVHKIAGDTHDPLSSDSSGNNPVYANLSSDSSDRLQDDMAESAPDRVFDNPIYGGNNEEIDYHQTGYESVASPYHEFDNPIYGTSGELVATVNRDIVVPTGQQCTKKEALASNESL